MATLKGNMGLPGAKRIIHNPTDEELRSMIAAMPNAKHTIYDNYNVQTETVARSAGSTYIATDDPAQYSGQTVTRAEALRLAALQDDYIREQEMVVVEGTLGNQGPLATAVRLMVEKSNANIAGMQTTLYFAPISSESVAELTIIYTPNLKATGYPSDRAIIVDLEAGVTRVFNSDYFGESKKGGLRMWNKKVFDTGGLPLHAGCKVVPTDRGERVLAIVGLSGTGKTTTTFSVQNGSLPVQDDFLALLPGGQIVATEDGCFAKTYGLDPEHEPAIHGAVVKRSAYLENVSQVDEDGPVDFHDDNYTQNGRAVFGLKDLTAQRGADSIGPIDALLILNRNENIVPAVARLTGPRAAAYFMLGETQGTSAGGKDEAGKFLRIPGTNPFFPLLHHLQGNRFLELYNQRPFEVFLMNTGRVGGGDDHQGSKKVKISHSSAVVKGIAEGTISWTIDPDFGYEVATDVPGFDDLELLQPKLLYQRQGRLKEYEDAVARFNRERVEDLEQYPGLDKAILDAIR
ncbi:phosphoenolpyruvate carboxykinase (ATP) [Dehalococcoidia bacterium]|nr:phosphoenolpyruvate carboxykinase (ATP) [Dehalococcoidia bacterium]